MQTCTNTGRFISVPLCPWQLKLALYLSVLSNLIINLMNNIISNCTKTTSTISEFENDFNKTR